MQRDLKRGLLFETAAEKYERFRPTYPSIVVDQIVQIAQLSQESKLLEIGCGTGKATQLFAARGLQIDCVDPGERLVSIAKVACRHWAGVHFTIGKLEDIALNPQFYQLVFSAQAFHWLDPTIRWKKCCDCMAAGGSIAIVYNYPIKPVGGVQKQISDQILELSRGSMTPKDHEEEVEEWIREMSATGLFAPPGIIRHKWEQTYSAGAYVGLIETHSDYMALEPKTRMSVSEAIAQAVETNGGAIQLPYETVVIHARKGAESVLTNR